MSNFGSHCIVSYCSYCVTRLFGEMETWAKHDVFRWTAARYRSNHFI